jgi:hypothetical protein
LDTGLAIGASSTIRPAGSPPRKAAATAVQPMEWAMMPYAGPCRATTAVSAAVNSGIEVERGP